MPAQEPKSRLPTPSSPRTPSSRWPPFTTGRRAAGAAAGVFGIACGCVDSKAVAVSPSPADTSAPYLNPAVARCSASDGTDVGDPPVYGDSALGYQRRLSKCGSISFTTATTARSTTTSSTSSNALAKSSSRLTRSSEEEPAGGEGSHQEPHRLSSDNAGASSSGYFGLLRQLSELESSVRDWSPTSSAAAPASDSESVDAPATSLVLAADTRPHHRKGRGGGNGPPSSARKDGACGGSVVVVKDTEDPVGEFQLSMLAMVNDRGMSCADELRELLIWFLALNAPENHGLVLLAFARVCQEVLPNRNPSQQPSPVPQEHPWVRRRAKQKPSTPRRRSRCCRGPQPAAGGSCYCNR